MATKDLRGRARNGNQASTAPRRDPSYYLVAGVALEQELDRLRALATFARGPLAGQRPLLKVRRARRRPNRLGFAVPAQFRLSVTAYPGIRPGDILETLLHELVHLHVGRSTEAHAWHGHTFKSTLAAAMSEAYGIAMRSPSSTRHGAYAEAIERMRFGARERDAQSGQRPPVQERRMAPDRCQPEETLETGGSLAVR